MPTLIAALLFSVLHAADPAPAERALPPGTIAVVLDFRVTEAERGEIDAVILWALLSEFTHEHNLAPTDAEFDAAVRHATGATDDEIAELIAQKESLEFRIRLLAHADDPGLRAAERELEGLETRIQNLLAARQASPFDDRAPSPRSSARLRAARWKTDQALFKVYGGRVALTPSGPEPIDAYRELLKEREGSGDFRFADEATREACWGAWNDDAGRRWLSADEAERYFDQPRWQAEEPE